MMSATSVAGMTSMLATATNTGDVSGVPNQKQQFWATDANQTPANIHQAPADGGMANSSYPVALRS
eukprot:NODE_2276_length_807_cov_190.389182_g1590_i0.p3 GENE.NODE_2276_length_807_cov_190.389182_g1590_i0~~NODE_2276_length_807_cov_190.389182_g1590_i0.p3  ORF type:complete len:66 (-),score=15.55 NODE_2276_length_807_cov_190.389182_g1590_i0:172-369(-)